MTEYYNVTLKVPVKTMKILKKKSKEHRVPIEEIIHAYILVGLIDSVFPGNPDDLLDKYSKELGYELI